jgi:hypothetical protein
LARTHLPEKLDLHQLDHLQLTSDGQRLELLKLAPTAAAP